LGGCNKNLCARGGISWVVLLLSGTWLLRWQGNLEYSFSDVAFNLTS